MTAPSSVQDELMPAIEARREGAPLSETRRTASYAVGGLERLKRKLRWDVCTGGAPHVWRGAVQPAGEKEPWPEGPWEHCAGCGKYQKAEVTP